MSGKDQAKSDKTGDERPESAASGGTGDETAQDAAERIVEEALREAESGAEGKAADAGGDAADGETGGEGGAGAEDDPLVAAQRENAELKDKMMRAVADAENTRRRAEKDAADARKYASSSLVKELLPAVDNLRRAVDSIPESLRAENEQVKNLVVGVEMTEQQIIEAFEKAGIRKINPLGEKFSYEHHQAVSETTESDYPPGSVAQVLQPGYMLHDRLLRPAMVVVAKAPSAGSGESGESGGADGVDTTA